MLESWLASIELPILIMRVLQFVRFVRACFCAEFFCIWLDCVDFDCVKLACVVAWAGLVRVEFVWLDFAPHDLCEFLGFIRF